MLDKLLDFMNVSSTAASSRDFKRFNIRFSSTNDPDDTKSEKQKMLISSQTYEGHINYKVFDYTLSFACIS